jgi:hypothetical protein
MNLCLAELDSIILDLNHIASRRRFMRNRLIGIAHQMDYVGDWISWCHQEDKALPTLHLQMALEDVQEDLVGVIRYKKFMRRELCDVLSRIRALKWNFVDECTWDDYVYGGRVMHLR